MAKSDNFPWLFDDFPIKNISHIYDFPRSAAMWLGISQPLVHTATMISPWFHGSQLWIFPEQKTWWATRRTRQSSPCISWYIWYITISVDSGTCGGFFRLVFAGHVTHITKKDPESQSISLGEASTIRTKHKNMGYTRSTNVFLLAGTWKTSSWWSREILGKLHQLVYPESTWWFPERHTPRGPKPPEVSTPFWGTPWINSVHSTPVSGWTEWAIFLILSHLTADTSTVSLNCITIVIASSNQTWQFFNYTI